MNEIDKKLALLKQELVDHVFYRIFLMFKENKKMADILIEFFPSPQNTVSARIHVPFLPKREGVIRFKASHISSQIFSTVETHYNAGIHLRTFLRESVKIEKILNWTYAIDHTRTLKRYTRILVTHRHPEDKRVILVFCLLDVQIPDWCVFYVPSEGLVIPVPVSFPSNNKKNIHAALSIAKKTCLDLKNSLDPRNIESVKNLLSPIWGMKLEITFFPGGELDDPDTVVRPEFVYLMSNPPKEDFWETSLPSLSLCEFLDELVAYKAILGKDNMSTHRYKIDAEKAFNRRYSLNHFPNTNFGEYVVCPEKGINELSEEVRRRESDVVHFQILLGEPVLQRHISPELLSHLVEVLSDIDRCKAIIEGIKFYANLRKHHWQIELMEFTQMLVYNKQIPQIFFHGGLLTLFGEAYFRLKPWFPKKGNTIEIDRKAIETDFTRLWQFYDEWK